MKTSPLKDSFSLEQVQFLEQSIFDVLESDFNYTLGKRKREAVIARALGARNGDALRQRLNSIAVATDALVTEQLSSIESMLADTWLLIAKRSLARVPELFNLVSALCQIKGKESYVDMAKLERVAAMLKRVPSDNASKIECLSILRTDGIDVDKRHFTEKDKLMYSCASELFLELSYFIHAEQKVHLTKCKIKSVLEESGSSMWYRRTMPAAASVRMIHLIEGRSGDGGFPRDLRELFKMAVNEKYPASVRMPIRAIIHSLNVPRDSKTPMPETSLEQYIHVLQQYGSS